jgi:5,10-methylenetetrahydromethanopterin reductase
VKEVKPPVAAVRESVEIVQMLLRGDSGGYQGSIFQIDPHVKLQTPLLRSSVPILIGTWGQQLASVAGELADEVKIGGSANPAMVPVMKEWIAVGERKAGRANGSVGVVVGAVCIVDEDGVAARTAIKREVALYLPVIAALDVTLQVDPELLTRIKQHVDAHEIDQAAALISDDLLAKFVFAGTPEEVLAHAQSIYDAGASRVEFGTPHGLHAATGIKLLGERVIPYLNR